MWLIYLNRFFRGGDSFRHWDASRSGEGLPFAAFVMVLVPRDAAIPAYQGCST